MLACIFVQKIYFSYLSQLAMIPRLVDQPKRQPRVHTGTIHTELIRNMPWQIITLLRHVDGSF